MNESHGVQVVAYHDLSGYLTGDGSTFGGPEAASALRRPAARLLSPLPAGPSPGGKERSASHV